MCGIAGWLSWARPPSLSVVRAMTERMANRGPDAAGAVALGPLALGHRRLSVIDVSAAANQPMATADKRYWIVFNGEIYNFLDLRRDLEAGGAVFATRSDTEVILEAYRRWGADSLARLEGMFAFALWDAAAKTLLLARDRLGEKPLHYAAGRDGGLIFASDLNAILEHPEIDTAVDARALGQYLALNYVLDDACLVGGVAKLPAAHFLVADAGGVGSPRPYWDLAGHFRAKRHFASADQAAAELRDRLDAAVGRQMVSDVPIGAFLSSGLDSSAVTAAMVHKSGRKRIETFSIDFDVEGFNEAADARVLARHLGVNHHDRRVTIDMAHDLPRIVSAAGEPMADTSIVPTFYLAAFAREQVTVCLSGDGADESFAGYPTYLADRLYRLTRRLPSSWVRAAGRLIERFWRPHLGKVTADYKLKQFLRGHGLAPDRAHYFWRTIFAEDERPPLLRDEHRAAVLSEDPFAAFSRHTAAVAGCDALDRALYVDLKTWLPADILVKVDRMTMAHSLECRAPFLDRGMIEFAASLPAGFKLKGYQTKHVLRLSQRPRLPRRTSHGPKFGFAAPVSRWLRGELRELGRAASLSPAMREYFVPAEIERLWREHEEGRADNGYRLFGLICLGLWLDDLRSVRKARGERHDAAAHRESA